MCSLAQEGRHAADAADAARDAGDVSGGGYAAPPPSYEFNAAENAVIEKCGSRTLMWGILQTFAGALVALVALGTIVMGIGATFAGHPEGLLMAPVSIVEAVVILFLGVTWIKAGQSLKLVVTTQGNDIPLLMDALARLGKAFFLLTILTIVGVVFAGLVMVAVFVDRPRRGDVALTAAEGRGGVPLLRTLSYLSPGVSRRDSLDYFERSARTMARSLRPTSPVTRRSPPYAAATTTATTGVARRPNRRHHEAERDARGERDADAQARAAGHERARRALRTMAPATTSVTTSADRRSPRAERTSCSCPKAAPRHEHRARHGRRRRPRPA